MFLKKEIFLIRRYKQASPYKSDFINFGILYHVCLFLFSSKFQQTSDFPLEIQEISNINTIFLV